MQEFKRKAEDEGDKDDALALGEAMRLLTAGEGGPDKELLRWWLEND